jgi:hypothetical protein
VETVAAPNWLESVRNVGRILRLQDAARPDRSSIRDFPPAAGGPSSLRSLADTQDLETCGARAGWWTVSSDPPPRPAPPVNSPRRLRPSGG